MRRLLEYAGYAAAVVLVAFGIGALVLSFDGKSTVKDSLGQEKIVGSPDMTPDAIAAEAQKAGLSDVDLPSCSVAGENIDTGSEARCFASYMRIHALEATGGKTYAESRGTRRRTVKERTIRHRRRRTRAASRSRTPPAISGSPRPRSQRR
jgi:hypothetical protein